MTKQTLATTLLLVSLAVLPVVPAVRSASGVADDNIPKEETTVSAATTTIPAETEESAVTVTEATEAKPVSPDKIIFDEEVKSAWDALDLVQRHFFPEYTEKTSRADGYHYSPKNNENCILTVADENIPYKIIMAVTLNDEPLTSAVYYVTPDGKSAVVGTKNDSDENPAQSENHEALSFIITLDTEISSSDEALELVQKHFAFEYTQKHSYETIGTYYTKPDNPNARLEYERGWDGEYIIHQYTEDGKEDFRYSVTSKDGKTVIEPYVEE